MAAKGESLLLCKCGNPINVVELREQSRDKAEAIHLTKTPAGMSQWLKDNYGYEVSRKQISNWLVPPAAGPQPPSRSMTATGSSTYGRFWRWRWVPAAARLDIV